jgi:integrase
MRVRLKGVNSVRKKLADGTIKIYWYAWKGGPALKGEFGSAEFIASFHDAISQKIDAPAGTLFSLLQGYQASGDFRDRAERTRRDYVRLIKIIEKEFGDFPIAALSDRRTRGEILEWRDKVALRSKRQADYGYTVLALVLSWAKGRGLIDVNPCERGGRLYRETRAENVWTADDEAAFLAAAPKHLHLPLMIALWTGQRQGDLLRLPWSAYDGERIRLKQSKTGCRVSIKVGAPLKAMLDQTKRRSPIILVNQEGKPWTADGFRSSWRKACVACGITGVTFNDLRGTAVTRLALAECTEAEIATITGHSLNDVRSILDAHYLARDPALGDSAIKKLETRTNNANRTPN